MKKLKYIAIGLGSFLGIRYLISLNRAGEKVIIKVSGERGQITAQGIGVKIHYNIQNPTRAQIKMTPPLIKLSSSGQLIASSTMQSVEIPSFVKDAKGRIVMNAFAETGNITTEIVVPWLSVAAISPQLLTRLQSKDPKDKVNIDIETFSHLFTLAGDFPYEEKTSVSL